MKQTANQIRCQRVLKDNPSFLHQIYDYNEETGEIRYKERSMFWFDTAHLCAQFNRRWVGTLVFNKMNNNKAKHCLGNFFGKWLKTPILIYAMKKGEWLPDETHITYVDGDPTNTRWENLRFQRIDLSYDIPGVEKTDKGYRATLVVDGETKTAEFDTLDEANRQQLAWISEMCEQSE